MTEHTYPQANALERWWFGSGYNKELRQRSLQKQGDLLLNDMLELQQLAANLKKNPPQPSNSGDFNVDLPNPEFSPGDELLVAEMMKARDIDPRTLSNVREAEALADKRSSEADAAGLRLGALKEVLKNPSLHPTMKAAVANKNTVYKPTRVKIRRPDGSTGFADAVPRLDGAFDYYDARNQNNALLQVPPSTPGTLQKDAEFLKTALPHVKTLESATEIALRMRLHKKSKTYKDAWADLYEDVTKRDYGRYGRDQKKGYEKTREIWEIMFPGVPVPDQKVIEQQVYGEEAAPVAPAPAAASPTQSQSTGQDDAIYALARRAIKRRANEQAVRARLKQLGYDPGRL